MVSNVLFRVTLPPLHIAAVVGDTLAPGFTVTAVVVAEALHPAALVAVKVYTPEFERFVTATDVLKVAVEVIAAPPVGPDHE